LESWNPRSNEEVFVCLDMQIGMEGDDGTNFFYVTLATPESLKLKNHDFLISSNRTIVISAYSYTKLTEAIQDILKSCQRDTYEGCCLALQRYFQWEYEDYEHANERTKQNIDERDEQGFTRLNIAILEGDFEEAERLLATGADPNIPDNNGTTPLMNAASSGNLEFCKRLVASGANSKAEDNFGDTTLDYAKNAASRNPDHGSRYAGIILLIDTN